MNGPFRCDVVAVFPGRWTPHAEILCLTCSGDSVDGALKPDRGPWNYLGECDECGAFVRLYEHLAREQACKSELQRHSLNASMSQTGGMCSAVHVDLRDRETDTERYLLITSGEEPARGPHPVELGNWIIGLYEGDECEASKYWERGCIDDVVHLAVSIADDLDGAVKPTQPEPLAVCWCGAPWQVRGVLPFDAVLPSCTGGHTLLDGDMAGANITSETVAITREFVMDSFKKRMCK